MANPRILPSVMTLYSSMAPEGRLFQQGEEWPGDAWSSHPGGEPSGANAAAGALKDLIEANDRADQLMQALASKDHDLAQMAKDRDEALAAVEAQKQAVLDAETAKSQAEAVAAEVTAERDRLTQVVADLQAQAAKPAKKADPAPADPAA